MYIYGYCYSREVHRSNRYKIVSFGDQKRLNISEIFHDTKSPCYDYIALKSLLSKNDILIIADVNELGRNKKEILDELTFLVDNEIRIMVLNRPETLFDFPENDVNEIEQYNVNVESSNVNLLQGYATSTNQEVIIYDKSDDFNCRIVINKELKKSDLIKHRPRIFSHPGTKNKLLIRSSRILAQLKN